jgi:outer membrane protein OmpA-like peptidoglycan-associated protein
VSCAAGAALGQDTVYIGGSGQTSVEIDLGVLDYLDAPRRAEFALRHPGVADDGLAPVTLRPPDDAAATTLRDVAPEPEPVEMVVKLEAPAATAPATVTAPEPVPDPPPTAAPEEMTPEERAAAVARNKDMVSSTSFANETARATSDEAPAAAAEPGGAPQAEPEAEIAALEPAAAPTQPGETMAIIFAADEAKLPPAAQAPLATVAAALGRDETLRLQLRAYAGGSDDSASHARRLSLSRALAVRSELIEQGVRSTRIDVRALGNKSKTGSSDRVDVILVKR